VEVLLDLMEKLLSEMSEEQQAVFTDFFLEALDAAMTIEKYQRFLALIEPDLNVLLGEKQILTIEYKTNYHIKIKLAEFKGIKLIDVIPYKLEEGKEVIGCAKDFDLFPVRAALRKLYSDKCMFTDKLLTLIPKSTPDKYQSTTILENRNQWANDFVDEIKEVVALVKKEAEDDSWPGVYK